jgi:hypothetical protein
LWPRNRKAFDFFTGELRTQWHHAGMDGVRTGLVMDGVRVIFEARFGKRLSAHWLESIQLCEAAALDAWHEQREADAKKKKAMAA